MYKHDKHACVAKQNCRHNKSQQKHTAGQSKCKPGQVLNCDNNKQEITKNFNSITDDSQMLVILSFHMFNLLPMAYFKLKT